MGLININKNYNKNQYKGELNNANSPDEVKKWMEEIFGVSKKHKFTGFMLNNIPVELEYINVSGKRDKAIIKIKNKWGTIEEYELTHSPAIIDIDKYCRDLYDYLMDINRIINV